MSPAAQHLLNNAEWEVLPPVPPENNPDGLPYPTHEGKLELLGYTLTCYRLSDGEAVFEAEDFKRFVRDVFEIDLEAQS